MYKMMYKNDVDYLQCRDNISIEAILEGDKEYSKWQDRDAMWLGRKK